MSKPKIVVVNRKNLSDPLPNSTRVYVGRPSVLGNPFPMHKESERDKVCDLYAGWLREQWKTNPKVREELLRLARLARSGPLELVCYCAPRRCHADFIKEAVTKILAASSTT